MRFQFFLEHRFIIEEVIGLKLSIRFGFGSGHKRASNSTVGSEANAFKKLTVGSAGGGHRDFFGTDQIMATGSSADMGKLAGPSTSVIDLCGKQ